MATMANPSRDDFAKMLEQTLGDADSFEGRVVIGTVTGIEADMAIIDVGLKSEGRVPLALVPGIRPKRAAHLRARGACRLAEQGLGRADAEHIRQGGAAAVRARTEGRRSGWTGSALACPVQS